MNHKAIFFSEENYGIVSEIILEQVLKRFGTDLYLENINFGNYLKEIIVQTMTKLYVKTKTIQVLDKEIISATLPIVMEYVNRNIQFIQKKPVLKNGIRLPTHPVDTSRSIDEEPRNYLIYSTRTIESNRPRDAEINDRENVFFDMRPPQDPYQKSNKAEVTHQFDRISKDRQCVINQVPEIPVFTQQIEENNGDVLSRFEEIKSRETFLQIPPTPSQESKFKEMTNQTNFSTHVNEYDTHMNKQKEHDQQQYEQYLHQQKQPAPSIGQIRQEQLSTEHSQWNTEQNTHMFMKNTVLASQERFQQDEHVRKGQQDMYARQYITVPSSQKQP